MSKIINVTLKKIISDKNFWICSIITFLLCFTAIKGYDDRTGDDLNIWHYFVHKDYDYLKSDISYCAYMFAATKGGNWLSLFVPMISSLSFVNVLCDDKSSNYIRYEIYRSGYFKFKFAQFISITLSSGVCISIGYIAFVLFSILYFPHLSEYTYEVKESFISYCNFSTFAKLLLNNFGIPVLYFLLIIENFFYGYVSALPALIVKSYTNNKYLIVCIPFLLNYFFTQLSLRLSGRAFSNIINPNSIKYICTEIINLTGVLLLNLILLAFAFIMFTVRRTGDDKGE